MGERRGEGRGRTALRVQFLEGYKKKSDVWGEGEGEMTGNGEGINKKRRKDVL